MESTKKKTVNIKLHFKHTCDSDALSSAFGKSFFAVVTKHVLKTGVSSIIKARFCREVK